MAARVGRVGLVSPAWPPGSIANGIVTYVANIRAGLAQVGVSSAVVASQLSSAVDPAEEQDVVDASRGRPPVALRAAWKVRERLTGLPTLDRRLGHAAGVGLRVAHARAPLHLVEMEESFGAARFAKGTIPAPLVVRLHGPWCLVSPALGRPDPEAAFRNRVASEGRAILSSDAISSPSQHALDGVRRHYGLALSEAAVIPNPIAIQPVSARWRLDGSDRRTVLFVGRFDRLKGGDVVLAAFARLAAQVPEAMLVFVGPDRGLRDDAGRTWHFDEYVAAYLPAAVAARVRMLGEQSPAAIGELRRRSFATLLASRFETFSMTAVEALSYGCPLVAPAAGAIVEIVTHERNGLLFGGADAEDASRQLLRLFREPELAQRLGAAGVEDAARRFAPDVVARQMVAFYGAVRARWAVG